MIDSLFSLSPQMHIGHVALSAASCYIEQRFIESLYCITTVFTVFIYE